MRLPTIPDGYALALVKPGTVPSAAMVEGFKAGDGVPILAEAQGAEGVLRALTVRMGGPVQSLMESLLPPADRSGARLGTFAVLRAITGGAAAYRMDYYVMAFHPDLVERPRTYADSHPTEPVHPSRM